MISDAEEEVKPCSKGLWCGLMGRRHACCAPFKNSGSGSGGGNRRTTIEETEVVEDEEREEASRGCRLAASLAQMDNLFVALDAAVDLLCCVQIQ